MGIFVAKHAAVRWAERGQSERVCSRSGRDPERLDLALEKLGKGLVQPPAPAVAVISGVEPVGLGDRRQCLRAGGRGIIGEKAHSSAMNRA